jgi:hypothetical protein
MGLLNISCQKKGRTEEGLDFGILLILDDSAHVFYYMRLIQGPKSDR